MRKLIPVLVFACLVPAVASAQQAGRVLELSFHDGLVTLVARNVTLVEVLNEWARKGGSKMVNAEKLTAGQVTYEFRDADELTVLKSLLRPAAGYIAAPRRAGGPVGASSLEQVVILATSRPTASTSVTAMPTQPVASPVANPTPADGSPDDAIPPVRPEAPPQQAAKPQGPAGPQAPTDRPSVGTATSTMPGVIPAPVKPGAPVGQIIK